MISYVVLFDSFCGGVNNLRFSNMYVLVVVVVLVGVVCGREAISDKKKTPKTSLSSVLCDRSIDR